MERLYGKQGRGRKEEVPNDFIKREPDRKILAGFRIHSIFVNLKRQLWKLPKR
jgi:hypothetical protein